MTQAWIQRSGLTPSGSPKRFFEIYRYQCRPPLVKNIGVYALVTALVRTDWCHV